MSKFEILITCKSCRQEEHEDCSEKRNSSNLDGKNNIVEIRCLCSFCKAPLRKLYQERKNHCKVDCCSGLYSDTLRFGFQVRCLCKCHNEESAT